MDKKTKATETVLPVTAPPASVALPTSLSEADKGALEMAKMNRKVALLSAEKALAENNASEMSYKYLVLQLFQKYGLTAADAIDEQGNIHRNVNNVGPQG